MDCDQGRANGNLECEFLCVALGTFWERRKRLQAAREMPDPLDVGRAFDRSLAGFQHLADGMLNLPRLSEVMRQQFRLAHTSLWKVPLQRLGDASMQPLPVGAQKGIVGGVLHERVLESVGGAWPRSTLKDQFRRDQPVELLVQRLVAHGGDRPDELVRELPPKRRANLTDLFGGCAQPIEARHQ